MKAEPLITTTLPKGYATWGKALADARKSTEWKNASPTIRQCAWEDWKPELFYYEKAHLVAQAAIEAEADSEPEGGQIVKSMAG